MNDADVVAFDAFLERNWGIKPPSLPVYDENGKEVVQQEKKEEEKKEVKMAEPVKKAPAAEGQPVKKVAPQATATAAQRPQSATQAQVKRPTTGYDIKK